MFSILLVLSSINSYHILLQNIQSIKLFSNETPYAFDMCLVMKKTFLLRHKIIIDSRNHDLVHHMDTYAYNFQSNEIGDNDLRAGECDQILLLCGLRVQI